MEYFVSRRYLVAAGFTSTPPDPQMFRTLPSAPLVKLSFFLQLFEFRLLSSSKKEFFLDIFRKGFLMNIFVT
jgi:hypothetical protein